VWLNFFAIWLQFEVWQELVWCFLIILWITWPALDYWLMVELGLITSLNNVRLQYTVLNFSWDAQKLSSLTFLTVGTQFSLKWTAQQECRVPNSYHRISAFRCLIKLIKFYVLTHCHWDHKIEATVKEGPADCIRMDEVAAALRKMKRIKPQACQG